MNALYSGLIQLFYSAAFKIAGEAAAEVARLAKLAQEELPGTTGLEKKAWLLTELKKSHAWFRSRLMTLPTALSSAIVDAIVAKTKEGAEQVSQPSLPYRLFLSAYVAASGALVGMASSAVIVTAYLYATH